jgi:VanZ family protein
MSKKFNVIRFLPSIIWMIIIFHFSGQQTTGITGTFNQRFVILKSFHLIEYAILSVLLYFGYKKYKYAIFTGYLYAVSDEIHQRFIPGREGRIRDTFIDLLGIFIGIVFIRYIFPFLTKLFRKD